MKSLQDQYTELLKLTRTYLLQEHALNDRLFADRETYNYFCNFVARKNSPAAVQFNQSPSSIPAVPILKPSIPKTEVPIKAKTKSNVSAAPALAKEEPSPSPVSGPVSPEPAAKKEPEVKTGSIFVPELPSSVEAVDVSEIRKILLQKHPSIHFIDAIPSDMEARKKARLWEQEQLSQILILKFEEGLKYKHFLENLCLAIEIYGWRIKIVNGVDVEKGKKWDAILSSKSLQLVLAASKDIEGSVHLKKLCREPIESGKQHTLAGIPMLLMADPAAYMAEPQLKPILWRALKELLAKIS